MTIRRDINFCAAVVGVVLAGVAPTSVADKVKTIPLKESTMIIEYNGSAEDIGIQFFLDADGWRTVEIFDPDGVGIFSAVTGGSLTEQGGGTELFLESVEPTIDELPFDVFFARFPEGTYSFRASDDAGNLLLGSAEFTHDIPARPEVLTPLPTGGRRCARDVPQPVVIAWNPVVSSLFGEPLDIVRYEVIVENDDMNFDAKFPATTGTLLTVSPELLEPDTEYAFEILAVEPSGNQTIAEGCFTTAR